MKKFVLAVVLLASVVLIAADTDVKPRPAGARPAWVKQGIVMAGNWEPLSFIRRRGGHPVADEEEWLLERTEQAARKLKEAGVNLVITNFFKGLGLAAEAEDMAATRRFTAYAHKHGLRVGGYIGSTMFRETFFHEEPAAPEWSQVHERGYPISYDHDQTNRLVACRNNPGYHAFIEKLLGLAVRDYGLDLVHFDQVEWWGETNSCRCRHCREQFREFLRARYPEAARKLRFGFTRLDDIVPPPFDHMDTAVRLFELTNPLMQEWARFRSASITRRFGEYDAALYALDPDVALAGNSNIKPWMNKGFEFGMDPGTLLQHGDLFFSEEQSHPEWTADGRLISKVRSFKTARIMGKSLFIYTGGRYASLSADSPPQLRLAEALAYNDNNLGMVGDVSPDGIALTPEAKRYIEFFHRHGTDLSATTPWSEVAVLRSFASMEFNPAQALVDTVLFEQALLQHQVPFDLIFDPHLADLTRYKVLVLANQDALSDEQVEVIRRFVERGGGLVVTGNTSMLTDWRLRRRRFGLAGILGIDRPESAGGVTRRQAGAGRVVYIPRIEPAIAPPGPRLTYRFPHDYWKLPRNHAELAEAVSWAAGGSHSVSVAAPPHVAIEITRQAGTGNLNLHLVNFNFRHPVKDIEARIKLPAGRRLREAVWDSPDPAARQSLAVQQTDGEVRLKLPHLEVYALVLLRLDGR